MAKSFKQLVSEVAQPKGGDEKAFKDQHTIQKFNHPVALDHQFTGEIDKERRMRPADYTAPADAAAYDKATGIDDMGATLGEEAEQIDEISKDMAQRYYNKSYDAQVKAMNTMIDTERARKPEKKKAYDDARKTFHKRGKGSDMAAKRLAYKGKNEEAEQIDEISKKLAGRYIKKAQVDTAHAGDQIATGSMGQIGASPDVKKGYEKQRQKGIAKLVRRRMGTSDAVRKLTGTARVAATEETNESQKKSLEKKLAAASAPSKKGKEAVTLPKAPWDKMKEATEIVLESREMIDEAVRAGNMRLKDGSSVKIKNEDAKLLNQMFKDLNSSNRRQMEKVMMTDKTGFEEILGFAREAL